MSAPGSAPPVLLYEPRHPGRRLPLSLLHVGSAVAGAPVVIVDGRLEMAPAAQIAQLAQSALCLGVTTPSGLGLRDALEVTRAARAAKRGFPVIWGGPHATFLPEQCLATGVVDACVIGEGERTFAEIVGALLSGGTDRGIPGVAFLREEEVARSMPRPAEDMNLLPPTDYGLLDLERHFRFRGARRLEYCSSRPSAAGPDGDEPPWSGIAPARLVGEVVELVARYKLSELAFTDQDFFSDPGRVAAISAGLLEGRVRVRWEAEAEPAGIAQTPAPTLEAMAQSGCRRVRLSAAGHELHVLIEAVRPLLRAGLGVLVSFVAGQPGQGARELRSIYAAAKALHKLDEAVLTAIEFDSPYPGQAQPGAPRVGVTPLPTRLEGWADLGLERGFGPWTPKPARRAVPRWNFYLARAFSRPGRRLGKRLVRRLARLRVGLNLFAFDFERWGVEAIRRLKEALGRPADPEAQD